MEERIPPSKKALKEALEISEEALRNIELSEIPLTNIALKAARIARLLNDHEMRQILEYEVSGYPSDPDGLEASVYKLAVKAGREFKKRDSDEDAKEYVYTSSIGELEAQISIAEPSLAAAQDREVSVSSANPKQKVFAPSGNWPERKAIRLQLQEDSRRLDSRRAFIYRYLVRTYHELKYSGIADDIFTRTRERVDGLIGDTVPNAVQRITAVYENLRSDNPEDWSNAVHSCRRILQDLADALFPPQDEPRIKQTSGGEKEIKLGKNNYINRLVTFVEDSSDSGRFTEIVGSHLRFIGERLDSVFHAAQKGSHDTIISKEEADRYVIYTYLLVGDILTLAESTAEQKG